MLEDRASREGLLCLTGEELRSVKRTASITEVYSVEDTVFARGKFATVRRASHKTTGVQYAAKYIKKRRRAIDMTPEIYHEICVLLNCSGSNRVVRLHEVYETNSDVVLVLELAAGGELQRIFDTDHCLTEVEARRAMRQILEGLSYLHDRNIAHLDLKPQNLLLTVEDCCDDIKLCDFGVSRLLEPGTEVRALLGTPDYVAPEVLSYEPISLSTDIWSTGVLAYVLLSGYTPFGAETKQQTYLNISQCLLTFEAEHFGDVSSAAIDFIKSALVVNPRNRPTVQELLQHQWITPKAHILPPLTLKTTTTVATDALTTPKSTPLSQHSDCTPDDDITLQKDNDENDSKCNYLDNKYVAKMVKLFNNNAVNEIQANSIPVTKSILANKIEKNKEENNNNELTDNHKNMVKSKNTEIFLNNTKKKNNIDEASATESPIVSNSAETLPGKALCYNVCYKKDEDVIDEVQSSYNIDQAQTNIEADTTEECSTNKELNNNKHKKDHYKTNEVLLSNALDEAQANIEANLMEECSAEIELNNSDEHTKYEHKIDEVLLRNAVDEAQTNIEDDTTAECTAVKGLNKNDEHTKYEYKTDEGLLRKLSNVIDEAQTNFEAYIIKEHTTANELANSHDHTNEDAQTDVEVDTAEEHTASKGTDSEVDETPNINIEVVDEVVTNKGLHNSDDNKTYAVILCNNRIGNECTTDEIPRFEADTEVTLEVKVMTDKDKNMEDESKSCEILASNVVDIENEDVHV